jgi:hypothetical protein
VAQAQIQDNLDVKKVLAPSKIPAKWLIMCFSRLKNIKSLTSKNSGTLIVNLIFADFMYYIALLKNQAWRRSTTCGALENSGICVGGAAQSIVDDGFFRSIYVDDGIFRHPHFVLLRHAWLL